MIRECSNPGNRSLFSIFQASNDKLGPISQFLSVLLFVTSREEGGREVRC